MTQPARPVPAVPSTAATLVLLRDRASSEVEVLLLQRHAKSKFAAGDYVFAGGKIEADDMPSDGESFCRGLTAAQAAARLGGGLAPGDAAGVLGGGDPRGLRGSGRAPGLRAGRRPVPHLARDQAPLRGVPERMPEGQPRLLRHAACRETRSGHRPARVFRPLDHAGRAAAPLRHALLRRRHATRPGARGGRPRDRGSQVADPGRGHLGIQEKRDRPAHPDDQEPGAGGGRRRASRWWLGAREVPTIRPRVLQVDGKPVPVLPGDPRWF